MPKVPVESNQISMNVPYANTPMAYQFGKEGAALEGLGSTVEQQSMNIHDQLVHVQAVDASSRAMAQDRVDSQAMVAKLKLSSPDGFIHEDPSNPSSPVIKRPDGAQQTIADEYHNWAQDRFETNQKNMPTPVASNMYKEDALRHFSGEIGSLQIEGRQMLVDNYTKGRTQAIQTSGTWLESNPSVATLYSDFNAAHDTNNKVVGTVGNLTEMQDRTRKEMETLSKAQMNGINLAAFEMKKESDPSRINDVMRGLALLRGDYSQDPLHPGQPIIPPTIDPVTGMLHPGTFTSPTDYYLWEDERRRHEARAAAGLPTVSDSLSINDRYTEERRLLANLPKVGELHKNDLMARKVDTLPALELGRGNEQATNHIITGFMQLPDDGPGGMLPYVKGQNIGEVLAAAERGLHQGPDFNLKSEAEQRAAIPATLARIKARVDQFAQLFKVQDPQDLSQAAMISAENKINKDINDNVAKKEADYASFWSDNSKAARRLDTVKWQNSVDVLKHAGDIRNLGGMMATQQKFAGPNNPMNNRAPLMSKDITMQVADALKNPNGPYPDERSAAKAVFNYKASGLGGDIFSMVEQGIKDDKLPQSYRLLAVQAQSDNNVQHMTNLIQALRGTKTDELFKKMFDDPGSAKKVSDDVAAAVQSQFSSWFKAQHSVYGGNQTYADFSASYAETAGRYAKQLMLSDRDITPDQAAKVAYKDLVGNYHNVVSGGGRATNLVNWSTVTFRNFDLSYPVAGKDGKHRGDQDSANLIKNLNDWMQPESLVKYNLITPIGLKMTPQEFADQVAKHSKPVYNNRTGAWNLLYSSPDVTAPGAVRDQIVQARAKDGSMVRLGLPDSEAFKIPKESPGAMGVIKSKIWDPLFNGVSGSGGNPTHAKPEVVSKPSPSPSPQEQQFPGVLKHDPLVDEFIKPRENKPRKKKE